MTKPNDDKDEVSRRQLFRTAGAVVAGGAALLFASAGPAEAKMPQAGAGYQVTPKDNQKCSNCSLFKSPSSCVLVDGTISPDGWCRFWKKVG